MGTMIKENKMATKTKAVKVIAPPLEYSTPASLIMAAVAGKANLEQVEKLMILQERFEKRAAEKAYNKAIADFKANPPEIIKESKVDFESAKGRTHYKYANLANVIEKVTPELSKHGLTVSWRTAQNGKVSVTCRISHELGHYEETTLQADNDSTGNKNPIQALGSAVSYLQRYSVLCLLGLACADADDDARSTPEAKPAPVAEIVKKQTLQDMVREEAKKHFKTPDDFKAWRVDNNLVENTATATELEMAKLFNYLKTKGQ
jgi:hypothetical protein